MNPRKTTVYRWLHISLSMIICFTGCFILIGCVSDQVEDDQPTLSAYRKQMADVATSRRSQSEGIQSLQPEPNPALPALKITQSGTDGNNVIELSIEDAVMRALSNSPEISVVSFDPAIAREEVTQAAAAFDPAFFGELNIEDQTDPTDSIFLGGESTSRLWKAGIKQRGVTGAEWSLAYALTRNWDDLTTRTLSTRYEPIISFQIRQPLLRDAWESVNLAGVDISKLNYKVSMVSFRQQTEAVTTEVLSLYWTLRQALDDRKIQQDLLLKTDDTLKRVLDRKDIDASQAQIKQAETSMKQRLAFLYELRNQISDIQDQLVRLLSDNQINLLNNIEVIPSSEPVTEKVNFDQNRLLQTAMLYNPAIQRVNLAVEIAQINVEVANQQKMPKLDLVASSRMSGLDRTLISSHEPLYQGDYISYAVGLSLEVPLGGNRQREAEYRKRILEKSQATTQRWNISDQVAVAVKGAIHAAENAYDQIHVQQQAVEAAQSYLQALDDTEVIRQQLTPEFLLVKLQAQEALADAARRKNKAITDYNIALVRLNQATGRVLDMRYVKNVIPSIASTGSAL